METTSSADAESKASVSEIEGKPEKIGDLRQADPYFTCELCDKELSYKIAQDLLSGLATACVDSTTGVLFKTPASVAAEIRKEMVDYLTVRSESFVAETVVLDTDPGSEVPDHPLDILSNMIDDFALSKKSLFSRVSGLMLTEMREDRIDEFTQGMERDSFWLLDKREAVAHTLIKNVDFKSLNHCNMKFSSGEEVIEHQKTCGFRPVMCENEGCNDTFSFDTLEHHDSTCPFKILPCEQNCSELLMRRDMDKHCITDCSMKLANCPFYSVGCQSPVPNCLIKKHCSENTHGHLLNVLQYIHKEASIEEAKGWAEQIEKSEFSDQLEARDVRTFTMVVKDIEKRIGPFEASPKSPETIEDTPAAPSDQATSSPPEQATATSPTDSAAAPPPKERDVAPRDVPSLSPAQETIPPPTDSAAAAPPKERDIAPRDVPSLSPEKNAAPPSTTTLPEKAMNTTSTQNDTRTTTSLQDSTSSQATTTTQPEKDASTTTSSKQGVTSPPTTTPSETKTNSSKQGVTSPPTTTPSETKTNSSKQGVTSPPTTTPSEKVVITQGVATGSPPEPQSTKTAKVQGVATGSPPEPPSAETAKVQAVATGSPPEPKSAETTKTGSPPEPENTKTAKVQGVATGSPPEAQSTETAKVQEQAAKSPSTQQSKSAPSLDVDETGPPQKPET